MYWVLSVHCKSVARERERGRERKREEERERGEEREIEREELNLKEMQKRGVS